MFRTVLFVCLIVLAVSGICELIHSISLINLRPHRDCGAVCVIRLKKGTAVSQLKFACRQLKWFGADFAEHIVALGSNIEGEELDRCRVIAHNMPVTLCPDDVLMNVINSITEK